MRTVTLRRTRMGDQGTFGEIVLEGQKFVTGELPWRGNASNHSSIPAGSYVCTLTFSPRFQRPTYELQGVPGRTDIRIHVANLMGDVFLGFRAEVLGCIALGLSEGEFEGQAGVACSTAAVMQFEKLLAGEAFRLDVLDEYLETGAPAPSATA